MQHQSLIQKIVSGIFVGTLLLFLFLYFKGYDSSIGWHVTTTAEPESFYTLPFKKGPFEFSFSAERYELAETFSAGEITRSPKIELAISSLILLGICLILAIASDLSRFWFIGIMGLFIFFIINLHLPEIGLFGFGSGSSASILILLVIYILPAYAFHAFYKHIDFIWRLLAFLLVTAGVVLFSGVDGILLHDQFIAGSYFGMFILSLLFLFVVAEEIVFAILYLITQSRGTQQNHIHFSMFSTVYLGVLIAYLGIKSSFWEISLPYFDPFILLIISSGVALWSLKFKKALFENILTVTHARMLFSALGICVMAFVALAFFRGNDPVYQSLHYLIIYTHVGFSVMFFLYIVWNFISPLGQGLQVYKIVYRSGSFPYVTARIGGFVAVAGFFFLANKEALLLAQAGHYNYIGSQYEMQNNIRLADEYYQEGSIFGYNNHFSNYKLGYRALQKDKLKDANYYFKKASRRFPSPQAFVNKAGTHAMLNESTPNLVTLQEGLVDFPNNNKLLNNLGLVYIELGKLNDAVRTLEKVEPEDEWTNAALVNLWKVVQPDSILASEDYNSGNLPVKTNVLSNLIGSRRTANIKFDTSYLAIGYPMHKLSFLINSSWYFDDSNVAKQIDKLLTGQLDEQLYFAGRNAKVLSYFKSGEINRALEELDYLVADAPSYRKGNYLNQMGLIALAQHAPELALDFFIQAVDFKNQDALTNQLACYLELGQFDAAKSWANYLVSLDSGFQRLQKDINTIDSNEGLTLDQQLFKLYYQYSNFTPAEFHALLSQADVAFIQSLWQKVSNEQLKQNLYENLNTYRAVFNNFLPESSFEDTDLLLALNEGEKLTGSHPLVKAIISEDSQTQIAELKKIANQNALNEPLVLATCRILLPEHPAEAYEVLVKGININNKSVALHKQFVMAALETGLESYAKDGLQKLTTITTQDDYQDFYQQYLSRKDEIDAKSDW